MNWERKYRKKNFWDNFPVTVTPADIRHILLKNLAWAWTLMKMWENTTFFWIWWWIFVKICFVGRLQTSLYEACWVTKLSNFWVRSSFSRTTSSFRTSSPSSAFDSVAVQEEALVPSRTPSRGQHLNIIWKVFPYGSFESIKKFKIRNLLVNSLFVPNALESSFWSNQVSIFCRWFMNLDKRIYSGTFSSGIAILLFPHVRACAPKLKLAPCAHTFQTALNPYKSCTGEN